MANDGFEQVMQELFSKLQEQVFGQHRLAVELLEARVLALEDENRGLVGYAACTDRPPLINNCGSCRASLSTQTSDATLGSVHGYDDMAPCFEQLGSFDVTNQPNFRPSSRSTVGADLRLAEESDAPPELGCGKKSLDGASHSFRPQLPGALSMTPSMLDENSNNAALKNFRVLEIWETPRIRLSRRRRKISMGGSMLTLEQLSQCSTGDLSHFASEGDEVEMLGGWVRARIEGVLQRLMQPPSSMRHLCWELIGMLFVANDIIFIPLEILRYPRNLFTLLTTWLIRIFWTCDIFMSFITGYVSSQGVVELRPCKVAHQYVRTRLLFDLILVGCDWVEAFIAALRGGQGGQGAAALGLLGMLRALRLARLIRLAKSQKISEFIFEHIRSEGVKLIAYIFAVMVVLLCLIHVIGCVWCGLLEDAGSVADGHSHRHAQRYFEAFHFVLALFAGDLLREPATLVERLFVILVLILAFVVSAAFVGSLTTAMTQLQIVASKRSTQFAALNRYLSDRGISRELAIRVHRNARHALQEQRRHTPESSVELLRLISESLRSEIHYEVYSPTITVHPFFCLYNVINPVGLRHVCHTAMQSMQVSRGDVIFSEMELPVAPQMFFLVSGRLVYFKGVDQQRSVFPREWIAEAALWTRWAHRGTLRALSDSQVLAMDAHRVANIMCTFPSQHGMNYACKFVEALNGANSNELTDLVDGEEQTRSMAVRVFQELDSSMELPHGWNKHRDSRRSSALSVESFVSVSQHLMTRVRRPSMTSAVPTAPE